MKTFKTFQLLTIVLAALFFQLPNQIHGSREQNEAITRLLQEMIELKHQSEGQHGNLQSRPETNMMGSRQSEDDSLSQDWPDINTMEFSSKPSPEFNLKIDGCEDMSSSIENSLKILLKPFGGEVTIACPKKVDSVGFTYTRWGSSSCPSDAAKLYTGRIAGSAYNQIGGANYLCVPENPDKGQMDLSKPTVPIANRIGQLFGTEYEFPVRQGGHDKNAVCAVCYVQSRSAHVMIPAQATCPTGWTREYYGYLMGETNISTHVSSSEYICVDKAQDYVSGSQANTNGALLYHIAMSCEKGIDCPTDFSNDEILPCSVCSK